jgi:hypothetical protein
VGEPDGTLHDWREIESAFDWDTLLLGNGLSINIWERFQYRNLYDYARHTETLTAADLRLFGSMPNFERVLGDILTAIHVDECVGIESDPLYERYRNIQRALGLAIRQVHVNQSRIPVSTLTRIREEMARFEWVFTTSYDLLVYWAMACDGQFAPFMDLFRGPALTFDPARVSVPANAVPVYFLHGALHLVVGGSGMTWKLRRTALDTLLEQFGQPIAGDSQARPLLITEGSATDKLNAIEENPYLSHALLQLQRRALPAVVFGSGLSAQDTHIAAALSEHPDRPVAVSMMPGSKKELLARQVDIYGRLEANPLLFFDAHSHPLGDPGLSVC